MRRGVIIGEFMIYLVKSALIKIRWAIFLKIKPMIASGKHDPLPLRKPRGMALIFVLGATVLLMVLLLGILAMGRTEHQAATSFSQITEVRGLSELPATLVMAQIREATSGLGLTETWASQPGMIRRFGTSASSPATGRAALLKAYRLYSSDKMVSTDEGSFKSDTSAESTALMSWMNQPASYIDLNEPVAYPDPTNKTKIKRTFPIVDVSVFDPKLTGRVSQQKGIIEGTALTAALPGESDSHPLPMPVRWIYLLRDGQMIVPSGEANGEAIFSTTDPARTPTTSNPITGRIAFWTDDETCKVNLNTASEGTTWDVPRTTGWTDRNYASFIPAQNEFQRFPGHPAMTCLSPILGALNTNYLWRGPITTNTGTVDTSNVNTDAGPTSGSFTTYLSNIYSTLPRTNTGNTGEGSQGGTQVSTTTTGLPLKRERLLASVDEYFYTPDRGVVGSTLTPALNLTNQKIQMSKFFLTTSSRAPETNLYNRPRISLWPLQSDLTKRNAKDKLLAFCSRVAPGTSEEGESNFQRASSWISEATPGSSQDGTSDYLLQHNQRLLSYLQNLTSLNVPAFSNSAHQSFVDKYGKDNRNHILLETFDLDRTGVNSWNSTAPTYYYTPPRQELPGANNGNYIGEATAVPTTATSLPNNDPLPDLPSGVPASTTKSLKAFGRYPTVVEVAIVFMASNVVQANGLPVDEVNNLTGVKTPDLYADKTNKMRAYLILQSFCPIIGMPPYSSNVRYRIKGLETWTANAKPLFDPGLKEPINRTWTRGGSSAAENAHATAFTGMIGQFMNGSYTTPKTPPVGATFDENKNYAFCGLEVDVSGLDPKNPIFNFSGGVITLEIHSGFGAALTSASKPVQTLQMSFPKTTIRVPKVYKNTDNWVNGLKYMDFSARISNAMQDSLISYGDTVRSVIVDTSGPSKGDYRHISTLPFVPSNYFISHPDYNTPANDTGSPSKYRDEAQTLRYAPATYTGQLGHTYPALGQAVNGRQSIWLSAGYDIVSNKVTKAYGLVKDTPYWQDCMAVVSYKLDGAMNKDGRPGDWDSGTGRIEDGPYINKPDAGGQDIGAGGYYGRAGYTSEVGKNYSPNRQICSAVAFGSLPTGVYASPGESTPRPWQTLLFCPNPPSRTTVSTAEPTAADHFGFKSPKDHLLLDFFWMPIVEPYAISEPFSTAGKINMNHQIMPFAYLQRATGLAAVLRSVRVTALPSALAWPGNATASGASSAQKVESYKAALDTADNLKYDVNYLVNVDETLKGFQARFSKGDVFRSASEICEIFLAPKPLPDLPDGSARYIKTNARTGKSLPKTSQKPKYEDMTDWWNGLAADPDDGFKLTGDNTRESPYNQLYPRLTTRSNTYQVHYRVQVLKKARSTSATVWNEKKDTLLADHRGSVLLERYVDPNDPALPNFVTTPAGANSSKALDDYYRFRIISKKQFTP